MKLHNADSHLTVLGDSNNNNYLQYAQNMGVRRGGSCPLHGFYGQGVSRKALFPTAASCSKKKPILSPFSSKIPSFFGLAREPYPSWFLRQALHALCTPVLQFFLRSYMSTSIFQKYIQHIIYKCICKAKSLKYCINEQFASASKAKLYCCHWFARKREKILNILV